MSIFEHCSLSEHPANEPHPRWLPHTYPLIVVNFGRHPSQIRARSSRCQNFWPVAKCMIVLVCVFCFPVRQKLASMVQLGVDARRRKRNAGSDRQGVFGCNSVETPAEHAEPCTISESTSPWVGTLTLRRPGCERAPPTSVGSVESKPKRGSGSGRRESGCGDQRILRRLGPEVATRPERVTGNGKRDAAWETEQHCRRGKPSGRSVPRCASVEIHRPRRSDNCCDLFADRIGGWNRGCRLKGLPGRCEKDPKRRSVAGRKTS